MWKAIDTRTARQEVAHDDQQSAEGEEAHVVDELVWPRMHMVHTKNLVVDYPFYQIEESPSNQREAE